jgi:biofilm PGA synthesis N-glycosyltransferase PgaC
MVRDRALRYVLITAAKNEASYLEATIRSVISQTQLPLRWFIVSDGSTDGTDLLAARYAAEHAWIELIRRTRHHDRNFAGKVHAFNAGYAGVRQLEYDVIGNLDADISFDEGYCAFLMDRFRENPRLGVAGTPRIENGRVMYDYRFTSIEDVSGACQMFRRECFESIGGYRAIREGGIDYVAVLSARARGWETRTFTGKVCVHHRTTASAHHAGLRERLYIGRMDHLLGSHPAWELFRSAYQMRKPPYVLGGTLVLVGYLWSLVRHAEHVISNELVTLRRREQIQRLKGLARQARASIARRCGHVVRLLARPSI